MIGILVERLKKLRKSRNLSQREVSDVLGVSPSIISAYETRERTPSVENILALSYLYKCSTDYLLGKISDEPNNTFDELSGLTRQQVNALRCIIRGLREKQAEI